VYAIIVIIPRAAHEVVYINDARMLKFSYVYLSRYGKQSTVGLVDNVKM